MRKKHKSTIILIAMILFLAQPVKADNLLEEVQHGYVENNGVKIHYVTVGQGSLIVMLHGFPDFWYTWRHQMEALSGNYQLVAIDLRGYNRSDKPKGVENYKMRYLVGDVVVVIQHFSQGKAIVVGHDWGGAIAWQVAMWRPDLVEKLVVSSTPHPNGLLREIQHNSEQQENSQYARDFQKEDAHLKLTAEELANWVQDKEAKKLYIEAFQRSDFEAMLNYYKASFPKQGSSSTTKNSSSSPPKQQKSVQCPTLVIFGLQDKALLPAGWNNTWEWIDNDLTMVSIPGAGHFVQQDASDLVTRSIKMWLNR
jgi:pimeloyl-ACP methyl ester carboxylesterase